MARPPPGRLLGELTFPEVSEFLREASILMLPIGAIEQHGPHLPLNTDVVVAREFRGAPTIRGLPMSPEPVGRNKRSALRRPGAVKVPAPPCDLRQRQPIVAAMPNYRRAFAPGGCWFFTVDLPCAN